MATAGLVVIRGEEASANAPTPLQEAVRIDGQRQQVAEIGEPVWKRGNFTSVSRGGITGQVQLVVPAADESGRAGNDCE